MIANCKFFVAVESVVSLKGSAATTATVYLALFVCVNILSVTVGVFIPFEPTQTIVELMMGTLLWQQ